jgi:hypothetical protein
MEITYISKTNSTSRSILTKGVEWCRGCLCTLLPQMGPTTWSKIMLKLQKIPLYKKMTRPQSITPLIGPGAQADHDTDSAAVHPGRMWNTFRSFAALGFAEVR